MSAMKNSIKSASVMFVMALGICAVAYAGPISKGGAPEIDPSMAVSSLTLLAGAIAVFRVRRKK
jgi:hypothetical protein